ncbi:MAG: hypothetical protein ACI910_003283 [Oleispira sp.]|jgi:hypothetical protein
MIKLTTLLKATVAVSYGGDGNSVSFDYEDYNGFWN